MRALFQAMVMIGALAIQLVAHASAVAAEVTEVVVAVVEPHVTGSGPGELGYSVSLGESKLTTTLTILNGLSRPRGQRLALLIHHDVSIGTLGTLVSMATKAGYPVDHIGVFLFDAERRSMEAVPGYRSVQCSTDPHVIGALLSRSAR